MPDYYSRIRAGSDSQIRPDIPEIRGETSKFYVLEKL